MDFNSDLLAVQANVENIDLCSTVLAKIAQWNVSESSEDRTTVAELFYSVLKVIQSTENEDIIESFYKSTIDAFENICQLARNNKASSSLIIIDFLNELYQNRKHVPPRIELSTDELQVLLLDLEPVKFIFKICDSDGIRYFPVNKLLGNIILDTAFINTKIEPYHINLIQLAVEMYKATSENVEQQFEELITVCNLKFIKYLNGACIRVDTVDMLNYLNNQVMIFYDVNRQKVLIRHEDKCYFSGKIDETSIKSEYNVLKRPIGYYVELEVNGTAIDFSEAIRESPKEFLRLLYEENCKNVLIDRMILKTSDGKLKPLNPFCVKDKWVVKGHVNGREGKVCALDKVIESVEEGRLQLFSDGEKHTVIDQISFGLCMTLLEEKTAVIDNLFEGLDEDDWIQNIVIKNWVKNSDNIPKAIEFALAKFADDLDYCSKDDNIKNLEFVKSKIRDCLPYSFTMKWLYDALGMPETASLFLGTVIDADDGTYIIDFSPISNKSLAKRNTERVSCISSKEVELSNKNDAENFFINGQNRYFLYKDGKWYSSIDLQNLYKLIVIVELYNDRLIDHKMNAVVHRSAFEEIRKIVMFHKDELSDISISKVDMESLIKIRLVNNLLLNRIDETKWDYYYNIFVKQQILSFSGIEHDEYFSLRKTGTLVVPKDRAQEDAVLRKVYEKYIRKDAERDLDWWFSRNEISEENDEYLIEGSKINTIRFLFDNTEHGTATIRILAANLGKKEEWIEFVKKYPTQDEGILREIIEKQIRKCQGYNCNGHKINLSEIVSKNQPSIEVCCFYGTREGDEKIKAFLKSCGFRESNFTIYRAREITKRANLVQSECQGLGVEYDDNIYIVIREFNMPKKSLLPVGVVGKTNNVVTLLVQKEELT